MSVFLRRFIDHKKYIVIAVVTLLTVGFVFGFYQYPHSSQMIQEFFQNLFYLKAEGYQNHYQLYVIQGGIFILICTYLSSSYLGHVGLLFVVFLKGLQLSFSLQFVFAHTSITFMICLSLLLEALLEIALIILASVICIHISTYVTLVTFYIEQNFSVKSMINYKLNCLIVSLIIFSLSLLLRVYLIPLI